MFRNHETGTNIENISYAAHMEMPICVEVNRESFSHLAKRSDSIGRSLPDSMNDERTDGHFTCRMDRYNFTIRSRPPFCRLFRLTTRNNRDAGVARERSSKCRTICAVALLFLHRKFFIVSSRRVNVTFSPFSPISTFKPVQRPNVTPSLLLTQRCASSLSRHLASN